MPTLAELRALKGNAAPRPRSTHTVTLVTGQHLLDEQKALQDELLDVLAKAAKRPTTEDGENAGPPLKGGMKSTPARVAEIQAEQAAMLERLGEHQGRLTLVGSLTDGEWIRWKDDHPPREDNQADNTIGHGFVNTTDLYDELGAFVAEWDGEPVTRADWDEWLAEQITFADKRDLITEVVALYETRLNRAPKSRNSSSETPGGSDDSD